MADNAQTIADLQKVQAKVPHEMHQSRDFIEHLIAEYQRVEGSDNSDAFARMVAILDKMAASHVEVIEMVAEIGRGKRFE